MKIKKEKKGYSMTCLVRRKGEMRNMLAQEPKFVLMCKEMGLAIEQKTDDALPSAFKSLLQEFNDMFPHEDACTRLPPLRGIEHQIDFVPGATLPNMATYRTNPTETKEI